MNTATSKPPRQQPRVGISSLARDLSVTPRTLRFYEEQGLLKPRSRGDRRSYGQEERELLKRILLGKRLGLSLAECRQLLTAHVAAPAELLDVLEGIRELRRRLERQEEDIRLLLHDLELLEALHQH